MNRLVPLVATAALLSVSAAEATDHPLTREQIVKRGDARCEDAHTATRAAHIRNKPYDPFRIYYRRYARYARAVVRIDLRLADRLGELVPRAPDTGRALFRSYVRGLRRIVRLERGVAGAAYSGDQGLTRSRLRAVEREIAQNRPKAQRYGFTVCGRRPG